MQRGFCPWEEGTLGSALAFYSEHSAFEFFFSLQSTEILQLACAATCNTAWIRDLASKGPPADPRPQVQPHKPKQAADHYLGEASPYLHSHPEEQILPSLILYFWGEGR